MPGCPKHDPRRPPTTRCLECEYLCRQCGRYDPALRRWMDDVVDICTCPNGAVTAASDFWPHLTRLTRLKLPPSRIG